MTRTPSNMLPLGTQAPEFNLINPISGNSISLNDIKSDKATVIMFICNHCPYVIHVRAQLVELTNDYLRKGISFAAINPTFTTFERLIAASP